MTPRFLAASLSLLLLCAFLPLSASAHGAVAAREYDVRILSDWTGVDGAEYVGKAGPAGPSHDILAVDLREAYLAPGADPALFFRITVQGGDTTEGALRDVLSFKLNGTQRQFTLQTVDNKVYTSDFDSLAGPTLLGDGHVHALDGMVRYATLGAQIGEKIAEVKVKAYAGSVAGDYAPGGFHTAAGNPGPPSVEVTPAGPADNSAVRDHVLKGPPSLVSVKGGPFSVQAGNRTTVNLTLTNTLKATAQDVFASIAAPAGLTATLEESSLKLGGGKSHKLNVTLGAAESFAGGNITLTFDTDLGSRSVATIFVNATAAAVPEPEIVPEPEEETPVEPTEEPTPEDASPSPSPSNESGEAKDLAAPGTPSIGLLAGLSVLALVAVIARRRQ